MKKAAITISQNALNRLKYLHSKNDTEYIRLGLKKYGCNGVSYIMNYTNEMKKYDELIEQDNIKILIDPGVLMNIIGTTMDFETNRLTSEFIFINPNSKGECGCGASFKL